MSYEVITVGGGLAGSTLATALARAGRKVLILERETQFKDRVRGENMVPWGVAAARRLGLVDDLVAAGGHQPRYWIIYMFGNPGDPRDLRRTTPHGETTLNIHHPDMQEALLQVSAPQCDQLSRKFDDEAHRHVARIQADNERYDADTNHGMMQGARWPPAPARLP